MSRPSPTKFNGGAQSPGSWDPPAVEEMQGMLPQYQFISLLGRGGMGAVYKAIQTSLDRVVAIKVLPAPLLTSSDSSFTERFKNEARTMAKMNHPAIVNIHDFGETHSGLLFIVMEFIDGTDVAQMIAAQGRLPPDHALAIAAHMCDALEYAHSHGVIHRDIKPANILINMEGAVKVADFGLAKAIDPSQPGLTQPDMAMGTPDFVAPEALFPGVALDGRADIYAMGVMLYQMLTGNIPRGMWQMPSALAQTDPRFDAIVARAMHMDREERHQSALELRRDLDVILTVPYVRSGDSHSSAAIPKDQLVMANHAQAATVVHRRPGKPAILHARSPARQPPPQVITYVPQRSYGLPVVIGVAVLAMGGYFAWQKLGAQSPVAKDPAVTVVATASPPDSSDTTDTPSPTPRQFVSRPAPASALSFGGHRYKFVEGALSWNEAKALAEGMGGHLVTLTTSEEDEWVRKTFIDPMPWDRLLHIGAFRSGEGSTWEWITGEPWGFENWSDRSTTSQWSMGGAYFRYRSGGQWASGWNPAIPINIPSGPEKGQPRTLGFLVEWDHDVTYDPVFLSDRSTVTFNGHRYLWVMAKGITLNEAKEVAQTAGAHLVTITSAEENDFIMGISSRFKGQMWTGGVRATGGRNGWVWMTEEPFSFPGPASAWQSSTAPGDALTVFQGAWDDYETPANSPNVAGLILEWDTAQAKPPPDALVFGANHYKMLPDKSLTWTQANAAAEAMGGHLATITSKEENDWIAHNVLAQIEKGLGVWIGGTSHNTPGRRRWVTSEPFDFTFWAPGEPSDKGREPALMFIKTDQGGLGWGDYNNDGFVQSDRRAGFLVEWEAEPPPAASPAKPELHPRLTQLKRQFDEAFERDVTQVYQAALSDLDGKYLAAVDRALGDATKNGRLDEALALQKEKERVTIRQPLPAADPVNVTADLKKLRDTYRVEIAKLVSQRDASAKSLYTHFDQSLATLQTEFTQKNLLAEALAVKSCREQVKEMRQPAAPPAGTVAAGGAAPDYSRPMAAANRPASTAQPPRRPTELTPEILKEPPPKPFTQEEAIHWALSLSGSAKVLKGRTEMDVVNLASIPKGKYTLIGLKIGDNQLVHVVSLAGLAELADLTELSLKGNLITDAGLAFLPELPKLTSLNLNRCQLTDASFAHLAKQPSLTKLDVANNRITGAGLSQYPTASALTWLSIGSPHLNDEGIRRIAECRALQSLDVSSSNLICTSFAPLAVMTALRRVSVSGAATDGLVQSLSPLTRLEILDMSNSHISDFALDRIGSMTALQEIRFDGCKGLTDSGFLKLLPLGRSVVRIGFSGTRLSDTGFRELSTKLTELAEIDLSTTGVSPAGLANLVNLRRLASLRVHARHCSDEGLRHLARVTSGANLKAFGISDLETLSKDRMNAVRAAISRWSFD